MDGDRQRHAAARELLRVDQHVVRVERLRNRRSEVELHAAGITLARVDWLDPRACALRAAMDVEMSAIYADSLDAYPPALRSLFTAAFDVDPATVVATVLVLETASGLPVGQAGLRPHGDSGALEVKKVIVDAAHRGRGISRSLMVELENVARGLGAPALVLQTGDRQPAAIGLYESIGYRPIPPYAPFELMSNALCYEKVLTPAERSDHDPRGNRRQAPDAPRVKV